MARARTLLRTSPRLVFLDDAGSVGRGHNDDKRLLLDTKSGSELRVSPLVAEILLSFAVPRTRASGIDVVQERLPALRPRRGKGRCAPRNNDRVEAIVDDLLAKQVLERYEPHLLETNASPRLGAAGGMFGAPALSFREILAGETADFVVLGMPYDSGTSNRPGARFAPDEIRRASTALFNYAGGRGAWDPVAGDLALDGAHLADAGNIAGGSGTAASVMRQNGKAFDMLERATYVLGKKGALPVVLGGDHSCSFAVIRGAIAAHGEIGVIQFDAHDDYGGPPPSPREPDGWRAALHHGNFMSWVAHHDSVATIAQLGVRQLDHVRRPLPSKVRSWPGRTAAAAATAATAAAGSNRTSSASTSRLTSAQKALLDALPDDIPYHLTIDVDALDPSVMPSTGTPVPLGFRAEELIALVTLFCELRRVVSIDIMEYSPHPGREADALLVAEIALRAMDAANRRRRNHARCAARRHQPVEQPR